MYITNCEKVSTLTFLLHTKCTHTTTRTQNQWTEQLFTVSENCAAISVKIPFYMLGTRYSVWHITFYMMCVCVCNPPLYHILFFNNYFKCVRPARTAVEWSGDDWGIYTIYSDSQSVFMHVITRWISYMCLHLPHSWQLSNPSIDFVVVVVNLRPFPFVKLLFSSKLTTQVYTFYEMWMAWMAILFWRPAYAITAMQNKQ